MIDFIRRPSPNFNARSANVTLSYVVLHYTDMADTEAALARLCDPQAEVSAHYVIGRDGRVYHLVDEAMRAWHAGRSCWRGQRDMNSASIGIELCNPGASHGYVPFPDAQIATLEPLLRAIVARHDMDARHCLLGHSDIAPARKQDPGHLFPWQRLAEKGYGVWPQPTANDAVAGDDPQGEARRLLSAIGYDVEDLDKALTAFQRRFLPTALSGIADTRTIALLRAVARD
jgi:N-acetylmuramoyl-L-alanine amidase